MYFITFNWRQVLVSRCLTGVVGLFLAIPAFAQAQYAITAWTIAGGGGSSSGGNFALRGTLGQAAAGTTMAGGNYTLSGGHWVPVSVDPSPAPELTITAADGHVILSWTPAASGWILQENSSLSPGGWMDSTAATSSPVVMPAAEATRFYRLKLVP